MRKLYERLLMMRGIIGYSRLWKDCGYKFAPGKWTPRFDKWGNIYMLIAPDVDYRPNNVEAK